MAKKLIENITAESLPKTAAEYRELLLYGEKSVNPDSKSARECLNALFDEGTFTEVGAYVGRRAGEFDSKLPIELEGVICGYGAVNGRLVYAFAEDMSRTKGAVSEASAEKVCSLYKLAISGGAPIVGIFNSAGAYLPEGVRALGGYGKIMKASADASGVIPQIALAVGVVQGASAVIASMFDFVIATEKSKISVTPAFVVGGGTTDDSVESGLVSLTAVDTLGAALYARELLGYLPVNNKEGTVETQSGDGMNRPVSAAEYDSTRNVIALISEFADGNRYFELSADYAKSLTTGFISLGGQVCGVVASNYSEGEGRLTSKAARLASKFISFCDSFGIPLITVVDSDGYAISGCEEKNPFSSEIARLAGAYASAAVPMITLISGTAYGSVFSVLGSKALGVDVVFALDSAKISCMNAKSAVALMYNDEISAEVTREELEACWNEYKANVLEAAKCGAVDDIIERAEIRQRLCSAVMMLAGKANRTPERRHINKPI